MTFETIKNEQSVDELYRIRIQLTNDTSDLHGDLHSGNVKATKQEILKDINHNNELIEYVSMRIKSIKLEAYDRDKEARFRLRKFKDICKVKLPANQFKDIERESFN